MNTSLSPELKALCEWASHEENSQKLLELTKRINQILQEQECKEPPKRYPQRGNLTRGKAA